MVCHTDYHKHIMHINYYTQTDELLNCRKANHVNHVHGLSDAHL